MYSQETYFDLSQDEIKIKTNFDGKEIIVFGLLEDDHDTILAIRGPNKELKIQKKIDILDYGLILKELHTAMSKYFFPFINKYTKFVASQN